MFSVKKIKRILENQRKDERPSFKRKMAQVPIPHLTHVRECSVARNDTIDTELSEPSSSPRTGESMSSRSHILDNGPITISTQDSGLSEASQTEVPGDQGDRVPESLQVRRRASLATGAEDARIGSALRLMRRMSGKVQPDEGGIRRRSSLALVQGGQVERRWMVRRSMSELELED